MSRLFPVFARHLHHRCPYEAPKLPILWEKPHLPLGAALDRYHQPALARVQVSLETWKLTREVTTLLPQSALPLLNDLMLRDTNDVAVLNAKMRLLDEVTPQEKSDVDTAVVFAARLWRHHERRDAIYAGIARDRHWADTPEAWTPRWGDVMRQITFTRNLAFSAHSKGFSFVPELPRLADLSSEHQDRLQSRLPDISGDDHLLILSAPGLDAMTRHEALKRAPALDAEVALIARSLSIDPGFGLQKLSL